MKKTNLVLSLFIGFTILSCSSDDDSTSDSINENQMIIGEWKITSETVDGVETVYGNCGGDVLNISENGDFNDYGLFENNGNCDIDGTENGTWTVENDVLILDFEESLGLEIENWKINTLTDTELKITEPSIEGEEIIRVFEKK